MDHVDILTVLNFHYSYHFIQTELLREGGNVTYAVYTEDQKFFLKVVSRAFADSFRMSVDINLYLQSKDFSVPRLILTSEGMPYVEYQSGYIALYEFLAMTEIDMNKDAEAVGDLIGRLHRLMRDYPGSLIVHDKAFYLDRYIDILRKKQYPAVTEFITYGEALWARVKDLPRGYSHGDMYCGNIARCSDGKLYILDFDTSCIGFPMYDLALICNQTDYFDYDNDGLAATVEMILRLLPTYLNQQSITDTELNPLFDMLALYHYALQATIIEIYGLDCVDNAFFDKQLDWLKQWQTQTENSDHIDTLFTGHYHQTLIDFITAKRMERAVILINTSELTLLQIAHECGYQDYNGFREIFREHYDMTPEEYEVDRD